MCPWYEKSFSKMYLDLYPQRDADEALSDIRGLTELTTLNKDAPLLDLCCGAGRHLCSLHQLGFTQLSGLDLSGELLEVASEDLARAGATQIELIHADMRDIPYAEKYATILSLFTSFGYFEKDQDNRAVIQVVYGALQPGGIFILDYFNAVHVMAHLVLKDTLVQVDRTIHNTRRLNDDGTRIEKKVVVALKNGITQTFRESVRLYLPGELREMIEGVGLEVLDLFGSTGGDIHTGSSKRTVVVCRKPTA